MKFKRSKATAAFALSVALMAGYAPMSANAEPSSELQERVNEAYAKLQQYTNEYELANNQLQSLESKLSSVQDEISSTKKDIESKKTEVEEGQKVLSERTADTYKTGGVNILSVILGSSNFEEFTSRLVYANKVAESDAEVLDTVKTNLNELKTKEAELTQQEEEQKKLVSDQKSKTAEVNSKISTAQSYYEGLDSELKEQLANEEAMRKAAEAAAQQQAAEQSNNTNANANNNANANTNNANTNTNNANTNTNANTNNNTNTNNNSSANSNTNSGNSVSSVCSIAQSKVGCSYVYGAGGPNSFDCSGLTSWAYAQVGISIPHSSQAQLNLVKSKGHLVNPAYLKAGDLVFYGGGENSITHVAIYLGGGMVVHATNPVMGVKVTAINWGGTALCGGSPV